MSPAVLSLSLHKTFKFCLPLCRCLMRFHTELHPFVCLQDFHDLDDIVGPWIAALPEHAMYAFVRLLELPCQRSEKKSRPK